MGYVVGNERSGMLVHSDTERDSTSGKDLVVERYEWLTYGVAVSSTTLMNVPSRMLQSTIGNIYESNDFSFSLCTA